MITLIAAIWCIMQFDIYQVTGDSMEPTIHENEYVLVCRNCEIEDGDIVVCDSKYILYQEGYIVKRYDDELSSCGMYLLGDNEKESVDSRMFGEVPLCANKGVVKYILSFQRGIISV